MSGFFKHIPEIAYDFKSDGKYIIAKDLFRKVSTWSYLREGVTGYSYFRITEGERPDSLAAQLYGDSTLYWLFFLVNEDLQDLSDWPKSQELLMKYVNRKYSGICLEASSSTDIVSYNHTTNVSSKFELGEKVSQSTDIYGFVTDVNPTHNRITLNSVNGTFTVNGTASGTDSEMSFTISSVVNEKDATNHYVDSNGFKTTTESFTSSTSNTTDDDTVKYYNFSTSGNTAVTNEEHERNLNDDKHTIRYIEPQFIGQVIREFQQIVSY